MDASPINRKNAASNGVCLAIPPKAVRESIGDLHLREMVIALSLAIMILWIGLYPAPFLRMMNGSVQALVDRIDHGTVAVLKERGREMSDKRPEDKEPLAARPGSLAGDSL